MQQENADPEEIVRVQKDLKEIQAFIDERKLGTTRTSNSISGTFEHLLDLVGMRFFRESGIKNTYMILGVLAAAMLAVLIVSHSGGSHSGRNMAVPLGDPRIGTGANK